MEKIEGSVASGEVGGEIPVAVVEGEVIGEVAPTVPVVARKRTSDEAFLIAWEGSKSKPEVAGKLGLTLASVEQRATKLRKLGWPLLNFDRKSAVKIDGFAKIAELRGITVEQLQAEVAAKIAAKAAKSAPAA